MLAGVLGFELEQPLPHQDCFRESGNVRRLSHIPCDGLLQLVCMVAIGPGKVVDEPGRLHKALAGETLKEVRFINMQNRRLIQSLDRTSHNGLMLGFHDKVNMDQVLDCIYGFVC